MPKPSTPLEIFTSLLAITEALPPASKQDSSPLARYVPGVWPTLGEFRAFMKFVNDLKTHAAEAEVLMKEFMRVNEAQLKGLKSAEHALSMLDGQPMNCTAYLREVREAIAAGDGKSS